MTSNSSEKPIVHIATDRLFTNTAYKIYEKAFPDKNRFLILKDDNEEIKYLSEDINYTFIETDHHYVSAVQDKLNEAQVIVFHDMNYHQMEIALSLKNDQLTCIWTVHGHEVYNNPYLFGRELYGPKTYRRFVPRYKRRLKNLIRPYYYKYFKGQLDSSIRKISALRRMNYVGILYKEELELFKEKMNLSSSLKQLKFSYYPLNLIINENQEPIIDDNILLGNSATYSNNHLEMFDILKQMNIGDRKIIVPLSYGIEQYAYNIIKEGKEIFGESFTPLVEFLPLEKYQKILQNCGIVVMNHYRKQAGGNILTTLYMGAKVYLSEKNILLKYLKRIGCHVYSIEECLRPENKDVFKLLSDEQIKENRNILSNELSLNRICTELQQTINPLLN